MGIVQERLSSLYRIMDLIAVCIINETTGLYEAQFKSKCHQCFRNLNWTSNIYIGSPIYISDIRYLYPTSDIPDNETHIRGHTHFGLQLRGC